jgi:hypothetical protein
LHKYFGLDKNPSKKHLKGAVQRKKKEKKELSIAQRFKVLGIGSNMYEDEDIDDEG